MRRRPQQTRHAEAGSEGFTLLEVMVAVTILGIALTAIFSSQAVSIKVGQRSRRMSTATLMARCKMAEIEELVAREGLPAISEEGDDGCCEDAEIKGFECNWLIERIVLPDAADTEEAAGDEKNDMASALGDAIGGEGGEGGDLPQSIDALLAGGGGGDPLTELAFSYAFPVLKPAIEEQVRRATVTVSWREGDGKHSFDVSQFLVSAIPVPLPSEEVPANAAGDTGGSASSATTEGSDEG